MDLSGLSPLSDYAAETAKSKTGLSSENISSKDYSNASDDELMEVCKEFESYFLEQCFKEMWKTVPETESSSGIASSSTLVDYYKDELIQDLSKQATEQNNLGLAQTLYEQMKRNYDL